MCPLHDFECKKCNHEFEELHKVDEPVTCPLCNSSAKQLIAPLADYSGLTSKTVQYATRRAPKNFQDSHLQKVNSSDTTFLRNSITKQRT